MSTEKQVKQQLSEYFSWLEGHLGSPMRPTLASAPHDTATRRVGRVLALVGVTAVFALVAVVVTRDDDPGRVVPATSDESIPPTSTTATTIPVTTVPVPTDGSVATTWAPINLPEGMTVVDVSSGSALPGFVVPLADQRFASPSTDGTAHDVTLWVKVSKSNEGQPDVANGEVHDVPISAVQPDPVDGVTLVTGWWIEHGLRVGFATTGLTLQEAVDLLEAGTWRADPAEGLEPSSIGGGMSLVFEAVGSAPRPYTRYVIETETGYARVEVDSDVRVGPEALPDDVPGVGGLFTDMWGTSVLTHDGTAISISACCLPNGQAFGVPPTTLAVAGAMAHVDEAAVRVLAAAAVARELALPEVGRVLVGDKEIVLRGGTAHLPEALCLVASGVDGCTLNHRSLSPEMDDLGWTNEWIAVGDEWLFLTYRPNGAGYGFTQVCPAAADGSIGEPLAYDQVIDGDRVWTVTEIPADVTFTMECAWSLGHEPIDLIPESNISGIVRRPIA